MAVVIRLQGLPAVAGSGDIRHFFSGLHIPDGGVHIIGGNLGDAFIIFATDEDARRAMSRSGGVIKSSKVQLLLSSKAEMQNILEMRRKSNKNPKHPALPFPGDINKLVSVVKKGISQIKHENNNYESGLNNSGLKHDQKESPSFEGPEDVYLFLFGLPYTATEEDIIKFFDGLHVVDIIFLLRPNGYRNGNGYVKFGSPEDAASAMERNNEYIGHRFISLKKASEELWVAAGGQPGRTPSKQPRKQRTRSRSPQNQTFYIHLKNLSYGVEKYDIKKFLDIPDMAETQIKFLLDKHNNRTREGFVMLKNERQFEKCLALHKSNLTGRPVFIFPIPRKAMLELIESYETQTPPKRERPDEDYLRRSQSNMKRCLYLRNFPFDVTKAEVQKFFAGFAVHEDDIFLLFDNKGVGLGEALVRFPSEHQAMLAESLNRQQFLGTEVFLRVISDEQTKEFGAFIDDPIKSVVSHSQVYREEFVEPSRRETFERSLVEPGKNEHGRSDFRNSPKRRRRDSYPMELGPDDSYGRFDMGNEADYHRSLPAPQSFKGRSPGAEIHMKNVPFTATIDEILDFFYGYNIIRESIRIKFTKNGWATGLATVCLENYDEALAAVNELHQRPIGSRKINLTLIRI